MFARVLGWLQSPRLRYTAVVLVILLPTAAMGGFGAWSLAEIDRERVAFNQEAQRVVGELNSLVFTQFAESLDVEALIPGRKELGMVGPHSMAYDQVVELTDVEGAQFDWLEPDVTFANQNEALKRAGKDGFANCLLTFRGDQFLNAAFAPDIDEERRKSFSDAGYIETLRRSIALTRADGRTSGYIARMLRGGGLKQGRDEIGFYTSGLLPPTGVADQFWVVWILDVKVIGEALQRTARTIETEEPLKFFVVHESELQSSSEGAEHRLVLPLDKDLLPMWMLAVTIDKERLPIQVESWRSTFYILFALVTIPLLGVVVWIGILLVRREIEYAKKKVDFVANVSHELKTPLTSIRMWIETLLMGRVRSEEERRESLEIILRESERLGRLIDRVLQFNKLERELYTFRFEPTNLSDVLRDTLKIFRTEVHEANERLIKLVIQPGLPRANVDRDSIREVVLNLLSNAVKYSPKGTPIYVRMHQNGSWLEVDVIDQGFGIPPDQLELVFEKFYRVDDVLNRTVGGSGLGLSISQQIVDAHGGRITVESTLNRGSRFTVRLPVYDDPVADLHPVYSPRPSNPRLPV